jgi:hypothetical protein
VRTCTHPWHPVRAYSRPRARVAAAGLAAARTPLRQRDRPRPALHLRGRRQRCKQRSARHATRLGSARSASTTRYKQLRAAAARLLCNQCVKSCGMRHLLRTLEHVCARVCTCAHRCAILAASAHAWLQLAWLRHAQRCRSVVTALRLPGRRQRGEQRSPCHATRVDNARSADTTRYK